MRPERARVLAWTAWAVSMAFVVAGALLVIPTRHVPIELYGIRGAGFLIVIPFVTVGALVIARRPRNAVGWLYLWAGVLFAVTTFAEQYGIYSFELHDARLPLTMPLTWFQNWAWILTIGLGLIFPLLVFPDGTLPSRQWRWVVAFDVVTLAAFTPGIAFAPGQLQSMPVGFENPWALSAETAELFTMIGSLPLLIAMALSIVAITRRYRRSTGDEHEQIKWVLYAGAMTVVAMIANLVFGVFQASDTIAWRATAIFTLVTIGVMGAAAGIAVLKYRLYDIDVVINRTLVFGGLAVFITVVYVGVVAGIGAAIGSGDEPNLALSIFATAIVAVAFQPARVRAHRFANRLVYGKRATPEEILSELGEGLGSAYSIEDVLPRLARLSAEATTADAAEVWLVVGAELRRAAAWPEAEASASVAAPSAGELPPIPGVDHVFAVRHHDELLGAIAVRMRPGESLPAGEQRLLADIASHAGLVLRNVRLIEDLRASRQRLVAAQDMERRRIERDLHDGAQQQLVALAVKLGLARRMLDGDPAAVGEMLDEMKRDTSEALDNLRALARGIYPPMLAENGLAAAMRAHAERAPLPVEVDAAGLARYPQQIESAVYFCILEALQNVAKYARASRATVTLRAADGQLSFAVSDDGEGFDRRTVSPGAGLTNMTDRIEALSGRIEIRSEPGRGTTVAGWIPVTESASPPAPADMVPSG